MPMDEEPDFYTQKGYQMRSGKPVTSAMEDYLEMICRQARMEGYARINFLAHISMCGPPPPPRWSTNSGSWGWSPSKSTV